MSIPFYHSTIPSNLKTCEKRLHQLSIYIHYLRLDNICPPTSFSFGDFNAFYTNFYNTFQTTRAVYNRMLELRVANTQTILNFASFLEEHKYFEESFSTYEKGLNLFHWPVVYEIWNIYLTKFIARYVCLAHT